MMTMTNEPTRCVKQLAIMGWVSHAAGVLSVAVALATEHWLRRLSNGHHVGIFPCCPTFKCDTKTISHNGNIGSFTDIIIVGLLLVGVGLVLSLTHSCVSWRNDMRPLLGMSYIASGFVMAGGITLVAGAIEFVTTIPSNMEDALREDCQELNDIVQTGFSYGLFVTGAVAFILAGILLLLSSCRQSHPSKLTRRVIRPSIAISESSMSLETVSAHLEQHGRLSPMLQHFIESYNNPVYEADDEVQQASTGMRRLSSQAFLCLCERLSQYDSERQSGRLSPNGSFLQAGRLSPNGYILQRDSLSLDHQVDRLSPNRQLDRLSLYDHRDRLSLHGHRDRLSPHDQHDQLSSHGHRDRLSPHDHRHRLSPNDYHDQLSTHGHRDRLSKHSHHDRLSQHSRRDRLSPHDHHDQSFPRDDGDRLSLQDQPDRQSQNHEYEFRPITSPPSYESLQELFLLNISADSVLSESRLTTDLQNNNSQELSESRQTTELHDNSPESSGSRQTTELPDNSSELTESKETSETHDLQDNLQDSAVQPPPYEDVLRTYSCPHQE